MEERDWEAVYGKGSVNGVPSEAVTLQRTSWDWKEKKPAPDWDDQRDDQWATWTDSA